MCKRHWLVISFDSYLLKTTKHWGQEQNQWQSHLMWKQFCISWQLYRIDVSWRRVSRDCIVRGNEHKRHPWGKKLHFGWPIQILSLRKNCSAKAKNTNTHTHTHTPHPLTDTQKQTNKQTKKTHQGIKKFDVVIYVKSFTVIVGPIFLLVLFQFGSTRKRRTKHITYIAPF